MTEQIHLPMINITPTMRCNLKCRLCGVFVPHYEYRPHMTFDEFSATLKAIFNIADTVGSMQITGGEPLLHSDLHRMIEECFKYDVCFENLLLFTNCTVSIGSELLDVLKAHRNKLQVHASDYGINNRNADGLLKTLADNGITYKYLRYFGDRQYFDGWVDNGDFVKHGRTERELADTFAKCSHVVRGGSWYVRGGQMHWCGRSIRGAELGKIPLRNEDYLCIFDQQTSIQEKRRNLKKLRQTSYIMACDYCNGYYGTSDIGKRYPAGEQMQ